jgi:hypothetical protein
MKIAEPLIIDYIDRIQVPEMSEEQKEKLKKIGKELSEICRTRKMKILVVDSQSPFRGLKEI